MRITYLDHSGFAVALPGHTMIFDYYNDDAEKRDIEHGIITRLELANIPKVSVFVSHDHGDHFNPDAIYSWADGDRVSYFLSDDIAGEHAGIRFKPGDRIEQPDMTIRAFGSTDLGVSFLVDTGNTRIFHAGDLNWWHWREESTPKEIQDSETEFKREMEPIIEAAKEKPFDIAFFPLDPRQRSYFDVGANYFVHSVKPRRFVPMHFMGMADAVHDYARKTQQKGVTIVSMTKRGQIYMIDDEEVLQ